MVRSLFKQFPKLFDRGRRELFTALQAAIALLRGLLKGGHLLGRGAVLSLCVIGRFNIDLAERHDVGPANDADILSPRRGCEPAAKVLLGVSDRKGFYIVFI